MIKLKNILNESSKKTTIKEGREARLLKSLKRNQFPKKWTLLDMINRYESEIFEYLWEDKGYKYDFSGDYK